MKSGQALRDYQRAWYANRRATFFAGKTCLGCGSTDSLELHHRDPSAKTSHNIWSWSQARREAEITKCDVLCHDCHARHTIEQHRARNSKLSFEQIAAILRRLEQFEDHTVIARDFGISRKTIWRILDGMLEALKEEGWRWNQPSTSNYLSNLI